jgi:hypothetical protein
MSHDTPPDDPGTDAGAQSDDDRGLPKVTRRMALGLLGLGVLAGGETTAARADVGGGPDSDELAHVLRPTYEGPESELPDPGVEGRRFTVTDTGGTYPQWTELRDTGSAWEPISFGAGSINTKSIDVNGDETTPLNDKPSLRVAMGDDSNRTLVAQAKGEPPSSDSDYQNRYPGIDFLDRDGYVMGNLVGDVYEGPNDSHLSIYSRDSPLGDGNKSATTKRMNIGYGSETVPIQFQNIDTFTVSSSNQDDITFENETLGDAKSTIRANADDAGIRLIGNAVDPNNPSASVRFDNSEGDDFSITQQADGVTNFFSFASGSSHLRFNPAGFTNFKGVETKDVVWRSGGGGSRPSSPSVGQRFFDTDLGQPIWYDGTSWVDAQGNSV